ncbi:bifunctional Delta(1)-pyrroline-2-carboxylate/Delta(1)-piperideine-2-carboxylate reductase [Ramlibacter alkalitolerans]|uniref:Ornithine cyclodeaminase family protein n=1 Tax=Ramlibacter alkalitolerans TaxID=2039631 RepID=A0ABS1JV72_9BURK|nr:ornithine cyclodeaminase family protein [Ramlibacter alkalitolerans]MBL0428184.1 ornithine cyclodeaminase family protein [Ramlibacter alkalitolerans]
MRIYDASATAAALPYERLVPALEAMFARGCEVPTRHVHELGSDSNFLTSLIMPAWLPGRYYGIKTINIAPGNAKRGLPGLHATYLLYDGSTGVPLALMDGDVITARRTAAASALAARWLARADARRLLVVGAGRVARELPAAYRAVRELAEVRVWARSRGSAGMLAQAWADQGLPAHAVTDLAAACAEADIVSCATLATAPVVQGAWLARGSHLDLIGSFTPAMREADDACFAGASLYVDTAEALKKSGELLGPLQRGVIAAADVRGTLETLAHAEATGRTRDDERTVFKSVGSALEDLAAAILVYEAASAT